MRRRDFLQGALASVVGGTSLASALQNAPRPSVAAAIRWAPGHYWQTGLKDKLASIQNTIATLPPPVVGVNVWRRWNEFETTQGTYDWSLISSILPTCQKYGKYLWLTICDRVYSVADATRAVPSYLVSQGLAYTTTGGGVSGAALWRPGAMAAKIALEKSFMDNFASNPQVVMVSGYETVIGSGLAGDYSASAYVQQEILRENTLRAYAPQVGVSVYSNFINGDDNNNTQMKALAANAAATGGIFLNGGPDAYVPGVTAAAPPNGYAVLAGYVGGKYAVLNSVQQSTFATWGATPQQVWNAFNNTYQAPYQTWYEGAGGNVTSAQLLAFLAANPVAHTAYPLLGPGAPRDAARSGSHREN